MNIKRISLTNFRNYDKSVIELNEGINVFYGNNAQGKTNIIESIYLSSIGKSFRAKKDIELVNVENVNKNAIIDIDFQKVDRDGNIRIEINEKKSVFINGVKVNKLSEILGNIYMVLFSPDDIGIFKGGPAKRRRALDIMISQLRPAYLYNLNLYLKTIEQRNNYLRLIKFENKSIDLLSIWDEKLADYAEKVYTYRKQFMEKIMDKIVDVHKKITHNDEVINIEYMSDCSNKDEFLTSLRNDREKDISRGYTGKGIHKDDFIVYLNEKPLSVYGSQGQHRTTLLSFKIAELNIIYDEIGEYPILLLDDFMSELDNERRINLLKNIENNQVIITCTEKMDIDELNKKEFLINNGEVFLD